MSPSSSRIVLTAAVVAGLLVPSAAQAKGGNSTPAATAAPVVAPAPAPAPVSVTPVASTLALTADELCDSYSGNGDYWPIRIQGGCTIVRYDVSNPADYRLSIVAIATEAGWTSKVLYDGSGVVSTVGVRYFKTGTKTYTDFKASPGKLVVDGRN